MFDSQLFSDGNDKVCNFCKKMESIVTFNVPDNFELSIFDDEVDIYMEGEFPPPKKHRPLARARHISHEDHWSSPWSIMLKGCNVANFRTPVGAKFRLRFRDF